MKKEYEAVWEIFNECANNQMRDVFFEEVLIEDTEEFIRNKFRDKQITYEKTILKDGSIVYNINASGILQRYTFTEI